MKSTSAASADLPDALDEHIPFGDAESENGTAGILVVAHAYDIRGEQGDLNAIAVVAARRRTPLWSGVEVRVTGHCLSSCTNKRPRRRTAVGRAWTDPEDADGLDGERWDVLLREL
jgi:hypothetical protein